MLFLAHLQSVGLAAIFSGYVNDRIGLLFNYQLPTRLAYSFPAGTGSKKVARLLIRMDHCRALSSARCEGLLRLPMGVLPMIRGTRAHVRALSAQSSGHLPLLGCCSRLWKDCRNV